MRFLTLLFIIISVSSCSPEHEINITKYTGFPSQNKDYSIGVTAPFVATTLQNAILAGGCNFPDSSASESGIKQYYNDIYRAKLYPNSPNLNWRKVGELPQPTAYGASIQMPDGHSTLLIGGRNENEVFDDIYRINYSATLDSVIIDTFPSLPKPRFNMAVTIYNNMLYVIGGIVDGQPSNSVISIDLEAESAEEWNIEPDFPESPRTQLIAVTMKDDIFIFGGHSPYVGRQNPSVSLTAYKFHPDNNNWVQINSPIDENDNFIALSGGYGTRLNDRYILLSGGVNKDVFLRSLVREQKSIINDSLRTSTKFNNLVTTDYLRQSVDWYRFNGKVLIYDIIENIYFPIATSTYLARTGAGILPCKDGLYIFSGEIKADSTSRDITKLTVKLHF